MLLKYYTKMIHQAQKMPKILSDTVEPALIATHAQPTRREMKDHQYLNMLNSSISADKKIVSLEYRHLLKRDKHKNTWVKSCAE